MLKKERSRSVKLARLMYLGSAVYLFRVADQLPNVLNAIIFD
jgi:hypothetical protein